jgi:hypothetical protein
VCCRVSLFDQPQLGPAGSRCPPPDQPPCSTNAQLSPHICFVALACISSTNNPLFWAVACCVCAAG